MEEEASEKVELFIRDHKDTAEKELLKLPKNRRKFFFYKYINEHVDTHKHIVSSQFRGVSWNKRSGKWATCIKVNRKRTFLGYYIIEEKASYIYEAVKQQYKKLLPMEPDRRKAYINENIIPRLRPFRSHRPAPGAEGDSNTVIR
jgi:hypothetical protein